MSSYHSAHSMASRKFPPSVSSISSISSATSSTTVCNSKKEEDDDPFESKFEFDDWNQFMPHLRFNKIEQPKIESLTKSLERILISNDGADVHIIIDDAVFRCHLIVLRSHSDLFARALQSGKTLKLPSKKVTPAAFQVAYSFMTNIASVCPREVMLDLLVAAQFLRAPYLVISAFECVSDPRNYSELEAFECYIEACEKKITPVMELMLNRVCKCFLLLLVTNEYRQLKVDNVCALLSSSQICVHAEVEVMYAAFIWLFHDYKDRMCYIAQLFKCVRFELFTAHYLLTFSERLHELPHEMAEGLCQPLHMAMLYIQELYMGTIEDSRQPNNRDWIRDPNCPYLKYLDYNRSSDITFDVFLDYMKHLRDSSATFVSRIRRLNTLNPKEEKVKKSKKKSKKDKKKRQEASALAFSS